MSEQEEKPQIGNPPSHDVYQVNGEGENAKWHRIGALWPSRNDSLCGDTVYGRLVLMPRDNAAFNDAIAEI